MLDEIAARIRSYVVISATAVDAVTLWCAHTHALEAAYVSPRLLLKSAEKRSGKTTLLHVIRRLVPRPLPVASISGPGIFRTVHAYQPTVLIDEADRFMRRRDRDDDEIVGIINSSHTRGDFAIRMVGQGTDIKPARFSTWCAMAIAGIGSRADTIEDRSITIAMTRKLPSQRVQKFRVDRGEEFAPLARQLARWTSDQMHRLIDADPDVPEELHDRAEDNWRPLLAIADAAGGSWPARARAAATELSGVKAAADDSIRVMLLEDLGAIFDETSSDAMASADLMRELNTREHRPWPELKAGKPLTTHKLARLLQPFGIAPGQIWTDGANVRGYRREQFAEVFARYTSRTARSLEMSENCSFAGDSEPLAQSRPSGLNSSGKPQFYADSSDLAPRAPLNREDDEDNAGPGDDDDIEREAIQWEGSGRAAADLGFARRVGGGLECHGTGASDTGRANACV